MRSLFKSKRFDFCFMAGVGEVKVGVCVCVRDAVQNIPVSVGVARCHRKE